MSLKFGQLKSSGIGGGGRGWDGGWMGVGSEGGGRVWV